MLRIDHPPTYLPERRYIYDVLLREFLGLDYTSRVHDGADVRISMPSDPSGQVLTLPDGLFQVPEAHWLQPRSLPQEPLDWCRYPGVLQEATTTSCRLPVLYGPPNGVPYVYQESAGRASIGVDIFGGAFFMLARYEEMVTSVRDRYDRFPARASLAWREGFLERPLVNEYLEILWTALHRLWPRLERRPRSHRVCLSHDVDRPFSVAGRSPVAVSRSLLADVLLRRDMGLARRRVQAWIRTRHGILDSDPANTFALLMDLSERQGRQSAFYFMACSRPHAQGASYALEHPWIRQLMRRIHERGHEVGLHTSDRAYLDRGETCRQFEKLRQVCGEEGIVRSSWGGRHHYLRWRNPTTWEDWSAAGLDYDSTLGFADHVGFRSGVCYEYSTFSLCTRRALRLRERPLIAMEETLLRHMGLSWPSACERILRLNAVCKSFAGDFTLLWHNSSLVSKQQQHCYTIISSSL